MARGFFMTAAIAASLLAATARAQDGQKDTPGPTPGASDASEQVAEPQNAADNLVRNIVGAWEFSNADHDKICHFNFPANPPQKVYKPNTKKNGPTLFPSTRTWSPGRSTNMAAFA